MFECLPACFQYLADKAQLCVTEGYLLLEMPHGGAAVSLYESVQWVEASQLYVVLVSVFGGGALWGHLSWGVTMGHTDAIPAATSSLLTRATVLIQTPSPCLSHYLIQLHNCYWKLLLVEMDH